MLRAVTIYSENVPEDQQYIKDISLIYFKVTYQSISLVKI